MLSNRQDLSMMLAGQRHQLKGKSEESEVEPLLDDVESAENAQLEEIIVEQVRRTYVEIRSSHLPSDVLLFIAAHLNLKDFIALSKTSYALHLALTSPRVLNSLYVRIPGVANDYTIPAIQSMLHSRFPELTKQKCLNLTAKASGCIESPACQVAYQIAGVASSVGGGFVGGIAAGISLSSYLVNELDFTNIGAGPFAGLVFVSVFLGTNAVGCIAFGAGYKLASWCKYKINLRAAQYENANKADPDINDKLIIFGLFKNSKQQFQQATLYHKSNHPIDLPKQQKMVP